MRPSESRIGRWSALGYTAISVAFALAFLALARWMDEAPPLAVWGGTVWVFVLSMIVSMPVVTALVKRRHSRSDEGGNGA